MTTHIEKIGSDPDRANLKQLLPNLEPVSTSKESRGASTGTSLAIAVSLDRDNAFRSILPFGVNGILSITAKAEGIM